MRDKLLSDIAGLASADHASTWARDAMSTKNTLAEADARQVEQAFEQKVSTLIEAESVDGSPPQAQVGEGSAPALAPSAPAASDEAMLAIAKPRRYRNKNHLRFVARQACLICGRQPSDPHHLRYAQPRALGRKASDEFTVPLCRTHHSEVHRVGNEQAWWQAIGIDPLSVAQTLWNRTRINEGHIGADKSERPSEGLSADRSSQDGPPIARKRRRKASNSTPIVPI